MSIRRGLLYSASAICAVNAVGFTITAATKTHKITDLCGSAGFLASIGAVAKIAKKPLPLRSLLLGGAVICWGSRLGSYLFVRVLETGDDPRLRRFFPAEDEGLLEKERSFYPVKLAGFWSLQSLWGFVVSLPATLAIAAPVAAVPLGLAGIGGCALFMGGFALETVADYQKYKFKSDKSNANRHCSVGVWSWSRHPNYAGEIMLWCGLWLLSAPVLTPSVAAVAVLSPVLTSGLLLGVSGVPLLEAQHDAKYGTDPSYQEWKRSTPPLIPGPWAQVQPD